MESFYQSAWPEAANWSLTSQSQFAVPWQLQAPVSASGSSQVHGFPSWSVPVEGVAEDRAAAVSRSHSQAEKRRRDRINAQLATLRKLIPKSDKMDKAALLGSVIEHVKDLKRKASEVGKAISIPTEVDEVNVDCDLSQDLTSPINTGKSKEIIFFRASLCCDDRPEVFVELIRVLKGLKLSTIKADISSVGGRMKSNLLLCNKDSEEGVSLSSLQQSLNVVLNRIASSSVTSNCRIRSKRQRLFLPSHYSQ